MIDLGIKAIGTYLPTGSTDVYDLGATLGADRVFISSKLGFESLARKRDSEEASDLCVGAFDDLVGKADFDSSKIDCVVVVTQNPDGGGLPHTSALVHGKLKLPSNASCFDVSLGCTGYVHGLSIIEGFLNTHALKTGLLFTADPYSAIIDSSDRDTALLFGDGATCTLMTDSPRYRLGKSRFCTGSDYAQAIHVELKSKRTLSMDGNQVYRFVVKNVPKQIRDCLEDNGLTLDDVGRFLVHQGSRFIVDSLAAALGVNGRRMPFTAAQTGNTVSSSIPVMLSETLMESPLPRYVLLAGFGVGLASCVAVLSRVEK